MQTLLGASVNCKYKYDYMIEIKDSVIFYFFLGQVSLLFDSCHSRLFGLLNMKRFWTDQCLIIVKTYYRIFARSTKIVWKIQRIFMRECVMPWPWMLRFLCCLSI